MQENRERGEKTQGPAPDQEIDEALRKFRLQTGLDAGSPILSFMRLALKASAPAGRNRRPAPPLPERPPERPDEERYEPVTPTSSSWALVIIAAALIGLLISWLARTGALN